MKHYFEEKIEIELKILCQPDRFSRFFPSRHITHHKIFPVKQIGLVCRYSPVNYHREFDCFEGDTK